MLYSVLHYVVCRGTRRLHGSRDDHRVPAPYCIHVEYLMALPALTAVAVATQSLVASNATFLILYGLGPHGPYGLGINIFLGRWDLKCTRSCSMTVSNPNNRSFQLQLFAFASTYHNIYLPRKRFALPYFARDAILSSVRFNY